MTAGGGGDVGGYEDLGPAPPPPKKLPGIVYGLTVMAVIGGFLFGYDTGVISGAMIILRDQWSLDDFEQELVVSVTVGAAAVFSLVAGWMSDRWGRKPVILASSAVFVAGAIVMAISWAFPILLIGRIIVGVAIGITSATVPTYIAETCPGHIRGMMITSFQLLITFGLLVSCIGDGAFSYLPPDLAWRFMLGAAGVPAVFQFIGFFFMPESPRWLVSHGKVAEAEKVLNRVSGSKEVADYELKAIIASHERTEKEMEEQGGGSAIIKMLSTPALRKALFVGCSLQLFQQLCGINTVMYYSATIIKMGGIHDNRLAIWMAAVVSAFNFLCTFIGIYLVERAGRKKLLLGSVFGVILCLIFLGGGFAAIAGQSPRSSYNETNGTNSLNPFLLPKNPCGAYSGCDSCSYDSSCGFCFATAGPSNGSCVPALPDHADMGATFGRCFARNQTESGPVLGSGLMWASGWCPSTVSFLPIMGMAIYLCCFSAGFGPMPWTINAEIYPNWARSTGTAVATATNWTGNLIISLTFLSLARAITRQGAFFLYAAVTTAGLVLFYFIVPETKGQSMEKIQKLFEKPWFGKAAVEPSAVEYSVSEKKIKMEPHNGVGGHKHKHHKHEHRSDRKAKEATQS